MKISAKWQKFNCLAIFRNFLSCNMNSMAWVNLHFSSVQFSRSVMSDSATPWITARQTSLSIIIAISSPCVYFKQTHVALLPVKLGAVAGSRNKKVGLALWGLTCYSREHLLKFLWGTTWSGYQCQAKHPTDAYLFFQRTHKIQQKMRKMWDQLHSQMRELLIHFTFSLFLSEFTWEVWFFTLILCDIEITLKACPVDVSTLC